MLAAQIVAICAAIKSSLGMVISLLESRHFLAIKTWLTLDDWQTTIYAAAQHPKTLASPNTCKSTIVTDSCFSGIDLEISTLVSISNFHLSHYFFVGNGYLLHPKVF